MPAAVIRRWSKPIAKWADLLQTRHLKPLAIRGAVMRKLLHIISASLNTNDPSICSLPLESLDIQDRIFGLSFRPIA
jgi:hypothetical protein